MFIVPDWLPQAMIGLAFGLVVSGINHYILNQGLKKAKEMSVKQANKLIIKRYIIRYVLNILALLLVYKSLPMVIATAIGLTASKNVFLIKNLFNKK